MMEKKPEKKAEEKKKPAEKKEKGINIQVVLIIILLLVGAGIVYYIMQPEPAEPIKPPVNGNQTIDPCADMTNSTLKNRCYYDLAMQEWDVDTCLLIDESMISSRNYCGQTINFRGKDTSACISEEGWGIYTGDDMLRCMAFVTGDTSYCHNITKESPHICFIETSIVRGEDHCKDMIGAPSDVIYDPAFSINGCYNNLARSLKDKSYCANSTSDYFKVVCEHDVDADFIPF